jgi:hypothetical protein
LRDAAMHVDTSLSSLTGQFSLGPGRDQANAQAVPFMDGATTFEHKFESMTERDWAELFRHIAALAGGGRLTLTVTIEPNKAHRPLQPVRIVTDPAAPALQPQDVDRLYPWRQKDLVRELNRRIGHRLLNSYDIQAVRRHHRLDEHPDFVFNLPGAGRRYSPALADWIMDEYARNAEFFHDARVADQQQLKLRRQKPK